MWPDAGDRRADGAGVDLPLPAGVGDELAGAANRAGASRCEGGLRLRQRIHLVPGAPAGSIAAGVATLPRAFADAAPAAIVVPVAGDRRGNPVLFSHQHAAELRELIGDLGPGRCCAGTRTWWWR